MTRVLPLPGPARISTGPSVIVTAFFCGSLNPAQKYFFFKIVFSSDSKRNIMRSKLLRVCLQLNPCYCITVGREGIGGIVYYCVRCYDSSYIMYTLKEIIMG